MTKSENIHTVWPINGGEVHRADEGARAEGMQWPMCRTGGQTNRGTRYADARERPVTCKRCRSFPLTKSEYTGPYSSLNAEITHVEEQIATRQHQGYDVTDHQARLQNLYTQR